LAAAGSARRCDHGAVGALARAQLGQRSRTVWRERASAGRSDLRQGWSTNVRSSRRGAARGDRARRSTGPVEQQVEVQTRGPILTSGSRVAAGLALEREQQLEQRARRERRLELRRPFR
jgi:hypothetical protein